MRHVRHCPAQVAVALACGLIAFSIGAQIALPSSLIPQLIEERVVPDFQTGSWVNLFRGQQRQRYNSICWSRQVATSYLYTGVVAALLSGLLTDTLGKVRIAGPYLNTVLLLCSGRLCCGAASRCWWPAACWRQVPACRSYWPAGSWPAPPAGSATPPPP